MTFCPAIVKWYCRVNLAYYIEHEQRVIKSTERKMLFSCKKLLTILLGHEGYTRFDSLIAYKKKQQENTEKFITSSHFILSSYTTISTLPILAVCRTRVKYEPSIILWPCSPWVLRSSVDRGLPGVWEVIGSNSVLSCWLFHFHQKAQVKNTNFFHSSWRQ